MEPGPTEARAGLRLFRVRLIMVRWARRYHASAFGSWRRADAQRVAAGMLGPYAEVYATVLQAQQGGDTALADAAQERLVQVRDAIARLVGASTASSKIQEVEATVRQQIQAATSYVQETRSTASGASTGQQTASHAAAVAPSSAAADPAASPMEGASPVLSLDEALVNERLAHELILNPEFQLPALPEPPKFSAPRPHGPLLPGNAPPSREGGQEQLSQQAMLGRMQSTMQELFWQRLVNALTPTTIQGRGDISVGALVQARYGGPQGTFYEAKVTACRDDGSFDIQYTQDSVVETSVPLDNFRLADHPLDTRPLLALITEVRTRLEAATPRRPDLHATYREVLDAPLLKQMLEAGVLDLPAVVRLARFVLESVENLEAPVRADRTRVWREDFLGFIESQQAASEPSGLVRALPAFFAFVNATLDQLQRDTVNFHLRSLAPHFRGDAAVEYERQRFRMKAERRLVALSRATQWLTASIPSFCGAQEGGTETQRLALQDQASPSHTRALRGLVVHALVELVKQPIRWDSPRAAQALPETLIWDGPRLAQVRDKMDQVILTSTILVFFRQVLTASGAVPSQETCEALQHKLEWLLVQPDTNLASIQTAADKAARDATASAGRPLPENAADSLKNLVASATDPSNAVFNLFTQRAFQILTTTAAQPSTERARTSLDSDIGASGLRDFRAPLLDAAQIFQALVWHHSNVFLPLYEPIIREAARKVSSGGSITRPT